MRQPFLVWDSEVWRYGRDADPTARAIFDRHYSRRRYRDGRRPAKFIGPGQYMLLLTPEADALFVWRKFISDDGQEGINCAIFRNEGKRLSSLLILDAEQRAWQRWPCERLYTYVNPKKLTVRKCRGREYCPWPPGRCFIEAGWNYCGRTQKGLLIFEKEMQ
jgi:hypothetical protein